MKFGNLIKAGLAAVAMVFAASAAQATPTYIFGSDPSAAGAFSAGTNSQAAELQFGGLVQTSYATASFGPATAAVPLTSTSNTTPIFGGALTQDAPPNTLYVGAAITSDTTYGRFNTTGGGGPGNWIESDLSFTINVGSRVEAFGFYGTDFADFAGSLVIELFDGSDTALTFVKPLGGTTTNVFLDPTTGLPAQPRAASAADRAQDASLLFFGFVSDKRFDRIRFTINQGDVEIPNWDYLGFDDIRVGNVRTGGGTIPEPGSLALAGLALFAAGWARKTQRSA